MKKLLLAVIIFISGCITSYATCAQITVQINGGISPINICENSSLTLSGNVTVDSPSMNGGFTYSWIKGNVVLQTAAINITPSVTTAVPSYNITGLLSDAGDYILRVEDGNAGNAVCYKEASVRILISSTTTAGTISASQTICSFGDPAAFTETTATTGGSGMYTYQWQSSTTSVTGLFTNISGATSTTYDAPAGLTATTYYRRIDGGGVCPAAATNVITVTVNPSVTPSVTISTPNTTICAGTSVTLTATPTNGGVAPIYQWRKNGTNIAGSTNSSYTTTSAVNGDSYDVVMTSFASCPSPPTAVSNAIVMTVTTVVTPEVSITADKTTICSGDVVTFTATPKNGGTVAIYQWWKNGINLGTASTNATYSTSNAQNGDTYAVKLTSNVPCANPATVTSNAIVMTVATTFTPSISIVEDKSTICSGQTIVFTATPVQGGLIPAYVWKNNGVAIPGQTNSSLSISTLSTPNSITAEMVSTAVCAPTTPVSSNAIVTIVNAGIGAGTIGSDQTICYNTIPATINQLTAATDITAAATYTWESSLDGISGWSTIPGATNTSYTPLVAITADMFVRRVVLDATLPPPCNTATSPAVHITVRPQLIAGVIGSDETICAGTVPSTITQTTAPAGGTGVYTYQWESDAGGTFAAIPGATNSNYSSPALTATTNFQRIETSGTCGSVISNEVSKKVLAASASIHIDDPGQLCVGDIFVLKCQATNMGTAPIYNWYVNNNIIFSTAPGSTPSSLFEPLKSGDEMYVELVSDNICAASASPVASNTVTVNLTSCTVSASPYTANNIPILLQPYVANSIPGITDYIYFWAITTPFVITGPNTITAGQQNVVYSVPDQTFITYKWSVTGGSIVSGQNTNAVTVDWDNTVASPTSRTTSAAYSISVTKTNQNNQSNTTTLDITTLTTGTVQSLAQSGINVFPNPTSGSFNITMPESGVDVTYEILDLTGLLIASGTFTSTGGDQKIDADLGAGMYQVVLKYNDVVTCARLSKVQ